MSDETNVKVRLTDSERRSLAHFVAGASRASEPFGWDAKTKALHAEVERLIAAAEARAAERALTEAADDYERLHQQPGSATGADWLRRRAAREAARNAGGGR